MKKSKKSNILPFRNVRRFYRGNNYISIGETELELGNNYFLSKKYVRFIKVTRKGFNFLDESTNRCILKRHLYASGYTGIKIPRDCNKFTIKISEKIYLSLSEEIV